MNPFAEAGDTRPAGTRQVANSTDVIYLLLRRFCRYSRMITDTGQPEFAMEHKRKEERLPINPTITFFVFPKNCLSVFFSFQP
jgi:hypothetical protein